MDAEGESGGPNAPDSVPLAELETMVGDLVRKALVAQGQSSSQTPGTETTGELRSQGGDAQGRGYLGARVGRGTRRRFFFLLRCRMIGRAYRLPYRPKGSPSRGDSRSKQSRAWALDGPARPRQASRTTWALDWDWC